MRIRSFLSRRAVGAIGVAGLFALQSAYEALFCGGGFFGFWEVTLVLAVPPLPYQGGGAAMGYVPAFLFGMPLALIAGGGVAMASFIRRRRSAHEG